MPKVLIVDDDPKLLKMLQRTLIYEDLDVLAASNGAEALPLIDAQRPDLLIVDWMMPRMDGLTLIRRLRQDRDQTLVLMLTARDAIENRVEGLESGADDYLIKPFAPPELVARVHALLRRSENKDNKLPVTFAGLHLDPLAHQASLGGTALELTPTEFDLLHYFMRHPRQVLERSQILTNVWGYDFGGEQNVLEVYVGYLRKKLESSGHPRLIHTIRGIGYALRVE